MKIFKIFRQKIWFTKNQGLIFGFSTEFLKNFRVNSKFYCCHRQSRIYLGLWEMHISGPHYLYNDFDVVKPQKHHKIHGVEVTNKEYQDCLDKMEREYNQKVIFESCGKIRDLRKEYIK